MSDSWAGAIAAIGLAVLAMALSVGGCAARTAPDPEASLSALWYADGELESRNDRCPVRHSRLNPAIEPVYVNGRPIGFC